MDINIVNLQNKVPLNTKCIANLVRHILKIERIRKAGLSFVFVANQQIKKYNKKFLNRGYATDVLSFPDGCCACDHHGLNGDVIISTQKAVENARKYKTPLFWELSLYIIHGILHLEGFDDHKKSDKQRMRRREQELLKMLDNKIQKIIY